MVVPDVDNVTYKTKSHNKVEKAGKIGLYTGLGTLGEKLDSFFLGGGNPPKKCSLPMDKPCFKNQVFQESLILEYDRSYNCTTASLLNSEIGNSTGQKLGLNQNMTLLTN